MFAIISAISGFSQVDSLSGISSVSEVRHFSKFYLKFYTGYGFLSPGSYRIQSNNTVSFFDQVTGYHDTTVQSQGKKGIGQGIRVGGGIGYVLNDFLNLGIDLEYGRSGSMKNSLGTQLGPYDHDSVSDRMKYEVLTITPCIIFKVLAKPNYFFYNKLGILFTLPFDLHTSGKTAHSRSNLWPPMAGDSVNSNLSLDHKNYDGTYRLKLGIGFNIAFGLNMRINDRMRFLGELFGNFSALVPSTSTIDRRITEQFFSYNPIYDNGSPPLLLYYEQNASTHITYEKIITEYHKGGPTARLYESVEFPANDPNPHFTYKESDKRFTANMNSLGLSLGIIYRL